MKNQKRLIYRLIALVVILSLTAGCRGGTPLFRSTPATPTAVPTPTQNELAQLAFEHVMNEPPDGGEAGVIQAESNMKHAIRETGGARAILGDQADAVFQQIDAAESAAVAWWMAQIKGLSGTPGRAGMAQPVALNKLIRAMNIAPGSPAVQSETMGVLVVLLLVPSLIADLPRDETGARVLPPMEKDETSGANATTHQSMRASLHGSKMDIEVEHSISVSGPPAYQESTTGTLSVELCPDAQGNVPLTLKIKKGYSTAGGGHQWDVTIQATGHVNDEGRLASIDIQSQSGIGAQSGDTGRYVEVKMGYSVAGLDQAAGKAVTSNFSSELVRSSTQAAQDIAQQSYEELFSYISTFTYSTLNMAEEKWTQGYCVEIRVVGIEDGQKMVPPKSTTPFTATVWHKFEAVELTVPVTARLADGKVAVQPSGSKVPAPASFTYQAPDEVGQKATVQLETRSKRGINERALKFATERPSYELEFDSTIISDMVTPAGNSVIKTTQHVRVVFPITWVDENNTYYGGAPVEYVLFEVPPIMGIEGDGGLIMSCPNETSASGNFPFTVVKLEILSDTGNSQSDPTSAYKVELTIDPGTTSESVVPVCPPPLTVPPGFSFPLLTWNEQFASAHNQEAVAMDGPYIIKDWTVGSGSVVATKTYKYSKTTFGILKTDENTTFTLTKK
jgi:hypothetical protein